VTDWRRLVELVDDLEARAAGYVTLAEVEAAYGSSVGDAITDAVLLVDYRQRFEAGEVSPVTLCRLNRQHALVKRLTAW
jgi:hypothetical protein